MSISTTKSRSSSFRSNNHRSAAHLKSLEDGSEGIIARTASQTAEQIQGLKDRLKDGMVVVKARVKNAAKAVRKQAVRTDKTIRAKPYQSMGVAAGAGLVAGYLIARRRSNSS